MTLFIKASEDKFIFELGNDITTELEQDDLQPPDENQTNNLGLDNVNAQNVQQDDLQPLMNILNDANPHNLQEDELQTPVNTPSPFFKEGIFNPQFYQFLTLHDILIMRSTCTDFQKILSPNRVSMLMYGQLFLIKQCGKLNENFEQMCTMCFIVLQTQQLYDFLYFEKKESMDWFHNLDEHDKDNAVQLSSQSIQHYGKINEDVAEDMEQKFGINLSQTQHLYEFLYLEKKESMDWFHNLDQDDKDDVLKLLSQSIQHYGGNINEDVVKDMEQKFGIHPSQTQQLYEFLYLEKNDNNLENNILTKNLILSTICSFLEIETLFKLHLMNKNCQVIFTKRLNEYLEQSQIESKYVSLFKQSCGKLKIFLEKKCHYPFQLKFGNADLLLIKIDFSTGPHKCAVIGEKLFCNKVFGRLVKFFNFEQQTFLILPRDIRKTLFFLSVNAFAMMLTNLKFNLYVYPSQSKIELWSNENEPKLMQTFLNVSAIDYDLSNNFDKHIYNPKIKVFFKIPSDQFKTMEKFWKLKHIFFTQTHCSIVCVSLNFLFLSFYAGIFFYILFPFFRFIFESPTTVNMEMVCVYTLRILLVGILSYIFRHHDPKFWQIE